MSADTAICMSPPLSSEGWKGLSVTLWSGLQMRYSGETRFYAGEEVHSHNIIMHARSIIIAV